MAKEMVPHAGTSVAVQEVARQLGLSDGQLQALKRQLVPQGATDDELVVYLKAAHTLKLSPWHGQIQAIRFENSAPVTPYITWRGLLAIATRIRDEEGHRLFEGIAGGAPLFSKDGHTWVDAWDLETPPKFAKVGVYRRGFREPIWAICRRDTYVRMTRDSKTGQMRPNYFWGKMGDRMLAKTGLRLALETAFPFEMPTSTFTEMPVEGQVVTDRPLSGAQLKALHSLASALGYDSDQRHQVAAEILGHPVESFRQLSSEDASTLLDGWAEEVAARGREDVAAEIADVVDDQAEQEEEAEGEAEGETEGAKAEATNNDVSPLWFLPDDLRSEILAHFKGNGEIASKIVRGYCEKHGVAPGQLGDHDYTALRALLGP